MPANPNSPFGFRFVKMLDGTAATYGVRRGMIASANNQQIFSGDVLRPSAAGYYGLGTVTGGGAPIGGIAESFEWTSISQQQTVRRNWWPGNGDASGDVFVYFYSNPQCVFEVQCLLGPIAQNRVNMFGNFNIGAGGRTFGAGNQSSFTLDDGVLTDTQGNLPFRIFGLPVSGPMAPMYVTAGYDPANAYNRVWVTMTNLSPD